MPDGTGAIALSAQNGRIQSRTKRAGVCETSRLGGASPALSRDGDSPGVEELAFGDVLV